MIDQLLKMADGPLKEFLANSNVDAGPGDASEIEEVLGSVLQKKNSIGRSHCCEGNVFWR